MTKISIALIVLVAAACGGVDDADDVTTSSLATATEATAATSSTTVAATETTMGITSTSDAPPGTTAANGTLNGCADVVGVSIEAGSSGFTIAATVLSADTGWEKYADAWQVRTLDGAVLGERVLAHPHETEQPFTRSLSGVEIPKEITEVVVVARDLVEGFCGAAFNVAVPHP
ncbi:MAG: hypothetical protein U9N84_12450 [Actinomycetota bacterium]|nr:hypothetical protein [Actinomycetota bacterium]